MLIDIGIAGGTASRFSGEEITISGNLPTKTISV